MKDYILKNGKKINFSITYKNLFKFQNENINAKDLVVALQKGEKADHETIMQMLYVGYLGGNNEEPIISYDDFLEQSTFDFNRDVTIFTNLISNKNNEKN